MWVIERLTGCLRYKTQLLTAIVFAGLLAVIVIGLLVDSIVFRFLEERTVRRWGMQ
jgi:NitT/TauT family transport system permease protein